MRTERIALTELRNGVLVSTVLIEDDDVLFYETMAFDGHDEISCKRTGTLTDAHCNHANACEYWATEGK